MARVLSPVLLSNVKEVAGLVNGGIVHECIDSTKLIDATLKQQEANRRCRGAALLVRRGDPTLRIISDVWDQVNARQSAQAIGPWREGIDRRHGEFLRRRCNYRNRRDRREAATSTGTQSLTELCGSRIPARTRCPRFDQTPNPPAGCSGHSDGRQQRYCNFSCSPLP